MKRIDFHSVPALFLALGLLSGIMLGGQIQIFNFSLNFAQISVIIVALILTNRQSRILSAFIAIFVGLIFQNSWQSSMSTSESYFSNGDSIQISVEFYAPPGFRNEREMTQLAGISGRDYRISLLFGSDLINEILLPGERAKILGIFNKHDDKNSATPWEYDNVFQEKIKNTIGEIKVISIEKEAKFPFIVKIYHNIRKNFEESRYNSLYVSLFTGDRSFLTPYIRAFFRESGLTHFLSISGLHIGVLITAFWWICYLLPLPYLLRKLIVLSAIFFLPFLVGFGPATIRAVIMGTLLIISPLFNRKNNSLNSLFLTFFLILSFYPMHFFLIGFQYSFVATLAVLLFPKLVGEHKYKKEIIFFTMPAFIFLATTPIQIIHFGTLTSSSIFANVFLLLFFVLVCKFSLISLFIPFEPLSKFILLICDKTLDFLFLLINKFIVSSGFGEKYTQISPLFFVAITLFFIIICYFKEKRFIYLTYAALTFVTAILLFELLKRDAVYTISSQNFRMKVYEGKNSVAVILGDAQTRNYYNPAFRRWLKNRLGDPSRATVYTDGSYIPQEVFENYTHIILENTTGEIRFEMEDDEQKTALIDPEEKKRRRMPDFVKIYRRRLIDY